MKSYKITNQWSYVHPVQLQSKIFVLLYIGQKNYVQSHKRGHWFPSQPTGRAAQYESILQNLWTLMVSGICVVKSIQSLMKSGHPISLQGKKHNPCAPSKTGKTTIISQNFYFHTIFNGEWHLKCLASSSNCPKNNTNWYQNKILKANHHKL